MINQIEIVTKLQDIFGDVFDIDNLTITMETSSKNIETWDSVTQVILMSTIEKKMGITFSGAEIVELQNVKAIVENIVKKLT